MIPSKLYRIRHANGTYSRGDSMKPKFVRCGREKVWDNLAHVRTHIKAVQHFNPTYYDECFIESYKVVETKEADEPLKNYFNRHALLKNL